MKKKLDLNRPVYELVQDYPELIDILKELGFAEITKPAILHSVGRVTTIPKGAKMRGISMMKVAPALILAGFELSGQMPSASMSQEHPADKAENNDTTSEKLKAYLKRLGNGEDLESVRKDFVENFSEVEASEIMKAEQDLMKEGTPITQVQQLCDVHSALFHGVTREEKIANAEKAVQDSLQQNNPEQEAAHVLSEIEGHPLNTWMKENEAIAALIAQTQHDLKNGMDVTRKVSRLRQIAIHYAKKGDLIYPVLKVRYEISGPSDVMWTVDDEIRDAFAKLDCAEIHDEEWKSQLHAVLTRASEMIYKETNILFPICAGNFTPQEWYGIYADQKDYAPVLDVVTFWQEGETYLREKREKEDAQIRGGEVVMGGGHMTVAQLEAMLNTLPFEISFVDSENRNRYFNEGPKVFKRPQMAIDREVFSCHPPKIEPMVRAILDEFRNNQRDRVPVWMEKNGKPFLVTYMAVRDKKGYYLGTIEVVQDMQFAKEHFAQ